MNLEVKNVRNIPTHLRFSRVYEAISTVALFMQQEPKTNGKFKQIQHALLLCKWFLENDGFLFDEIMAVVPLLTDHKKEVSDAISDMLKISDVTQIKQLEQTDNYGLLYVTFAQAQVELTKKYDAILKKLDVFQLDLAKILDSFHFPSNTVIMDTNVLSYFNELIPGSYYSSRKYSVNLGKYQIYINAGTIKENNSHVHGTHLFYPELIKILNIRTFTLTPTDAEIADVLQKWELTAKGIKLIKNRGSNARREFKKSVDMMIIIQTLRLAQRGTVFCISNDNEILDILERYHYENRISLLKIKDNTLIDVQRKKK